GEGRGMDCGSDQPEQGRARLIRYLRSIGYRPLVAAGLVVTALVALGAVGYAGVKTFSDYTYGYGYAYQYQYGESHIIVIKHVVNDDGGDAAASQSTMTINGVTATGGNSFPGAESPGTNKTVTPGSYNVTETGPSGYIAVPSAGCSGSIALGETKTCTIVNHDIAKRLTIGYWKNHRAQTTALLPQKLGNYVVGTFAQVTAVFNTTNCSS